MNERKELEIYRNLLIKLATSRWCMNETNIVKILDKISAYSYARTNSNGDEAQDLINQEKTLKELAKI